jgi:hypothetical protein
VNSRGSLPVLAYWHSLNPAESVSARVARTKRPEAGYFPAAFLSA